MALDLGELVGTVRLDSTLFDRQYQQIETALRQLAGLDPNVQVTANTATAVGNIAEVGNAAQAIPDGNLVVTADTSQAAGAVDDLGSQAEDSLADAGAEGGDQMGAGILAALVALPIAGTLVALGAVAGKALVDGLQNEVREDRLAATTGLDPVSVKRIATAAGEAFAANFGESIEANMDTARVAIQAGLLDPASTARDSKAVIEQLSGVADVLGEDIPRVAQATAVVLRTGLAKDAAGAFDIFVRGAQTGANASEDLLDTFIEYPALFQRLGLSGSDALGLVNQGLEAGARNSDLVADALKEFQIRATDASETSAAGYEAIGLSAEEMTAKIAAGGEGAREGLGQVLDGLRAIEDPTKRNIAATALFGTQAEDLGSALFEMNLGTIAAQLGQVEGAASGAIATLGDNDAGRIESAWRDIQVAVDGVKGALAQSFGDEIKEFTTFISENREAVVQFLLDLANGGLDAGRAIVEGGAAGIETFGELSGAVSDVAWQMTEMLLALNEIPGISGKLDSAVQGMGRAAVAAGQIEEGAAKSADALRENLIAGAIDPAQAKLNALAQPLLGEAAFHDSTVALAADINGLGYAADGSRIEIERLGGGFNTTSANGALLDSQIRAAVASLDAQTAAGVEAGRTTEELTADYAANRQALLDQVTAMGFTKAEAEALISTYGAIPATKKTTIIAETASARESIKAFREDIDNIPLTRTFTARYAEVQAAGGNTPGRASGGPVWPGQPFWVGEEGPELVTFPSSGFVHNARDSAAMSSGGQSMSGLAIEGTLDLGNGLTGYMRGVVKSELASEARSRASRPR